MSRRIRPPKLNARQRQDHHYYESRVMRRGTSRGLDSERDRIDTVDGVAVGEQQIWPPGPWVTHRSKGARR